MSEEIDYLDMAKRRVVSSLSGWDDVPAVGDDPGGFRIVLGGNVYFGSEDPDDGYRSYMKCLERELGGVVKNRFDPINVTWRIKEGSSEEVVELVADGGRVVAEFGTDRSDSYYPCFVANFNPKVLPINAARKAFDDAMAAAKPVERARTYAGWGSW